ncbi:41591_t:CDS:10, partial [Gigaspora margarita]
MTEDKSLNYSFVSTFQNEPPLVPYSLPIIGHTFEYFTNTESFIKKCHKQYGEIFSVYVLGHVITTIGKELIPEAIKNHNDFNFFEAFKETLPTDSLLGRPKIFFENLIKVVQENFSSTGRYTTYMNKIQDAIKISINKSIGECKDPKCIKIPQKVFSQLIARNIKLLDDDEIINTFASLTSDITRVLKFPPILNFIHKSIQRQFTIIRLKYFNNFYIKHRNLIFERLSQIIEQQEHEKNKLGDAWTPPTFIKFSIEDNSVDLQLLTDYIIEFIFISVQTTSDAIIFILYESIKYWMPCVGLQRKTISDYFTFSNGYQVPKDRNINLYIANLHDTDQIGRKFDGFQYVGKDSSTTKLGEEYITFGRGKHA